MLNFCCDDSGLVSLWSQQNLTDGSPISFDFCMDRSCSIASLFPFTEMPGLDTGMYIPIMVPYVGCQEFLGLGSQFLVISDFLRTCGVSIPRTLHLWSVGHIWKSVMALPSLTNPFVLNLPLLQRQADCLYQSLRGLLASQMSILFLKALCAASSLQALQILNLSLRLKEIVMPWTKDPPAGICCLLIPYSVLQPTASMASRNWGVPQLLWVVANEQFYSTFFIFSFCGLRMSTTSQATSLCVCVDCYVCVSVYTHVQK